MRIDEFEPKITRNSFLIELLEKLMNTLQLKARKE